MRKNLGIGLILVACIGMTGPAFAAGYLKLDDIKGEAADDAHQAAPAAPDRVKGSHNAQPLGLLLPAVQKVPMPADAPGRKKGNVENSWKVEEGRK